MVGWQRSRAARSAEDWEEAALDSIAAGGIRSLAIPALAASLGVTKGSFYWHFDTLQSLIAAALRRWERADLHSIAELERIADPRRRLRAAFAEGMQVARAQSLYVTLTDASEPSVVRLLRRVSNRRIRFLTAAYAESGFAPAEARHRALLTYTAYLGVIHLRRQSVAGLRSDREIQDYAAHAARTLIPKRRGHS
jgi:AcrR family transcriptional regulator